MEEGELVGFGDSLKWGVGGGGCEVGKDCKMFFWFSSEEVIDVF